MKHENRKRTRLAVGVSAAFLLALLLAPPFSRAQGGTAAAQGAQANPPGPEKQTAAAFEERVKEYVKLREGLEEKLPKLPKEATSEQIERHKASFQEIVRSARAGAKHGDVFTPEAAAHVRKVVKTVLDAREKEEVREKVFEADNKNVPIRVNYTYPESAELVEMPPTLLMQLPTLPKQVKYRFVGRNLLLVDRENGLIIDYMTDALPDARAQAEQPRASGSQVGAAAAAQPAPAPSAPVRLTLPNKADSVRFLVIGDTGTGTAQQHELSRVMMQYHGAFPYEFALMLGDNMYGSEKAADFKKKFEDVYRGLLDKQVKFYATLGNHDESNQRFYEHFNLGGEEYMHFRKGNVSFYNLNSNYMDKKQVKWLEEKLAADTAEWKVAFMHHPPYSSGGKHGSSTGLREIVEPIFLKHGVNVVLAGHEHFYERVKPQKGIYYFISGAGGKLREGDVKDNSPLTEKAYDSDMSFMLVEIDKEQMHFQVINRTGETVDSGALPRQKKSGAATTATAAK